jgi:hypothetical protein
MRELETLTAVLAFAAVFLFGWRLQITRKGWRRAGLSAASGASVAYVFVHLLPDLSEAGETFVSTAASQVVLFPRSHVYLAALAGFIVFYGLEHMVMRSRATEGGEAANIHSGKFAFRLQIGGFAAYAMLVSDGVVRGTGLAQASLTLYTVAMGLHFLSVDHALFREHGALYLRRGRFILAGAVLAGWVCGQLLEIPRPLLCSLLGIVAGGVIMNGAIMELPREKEGRFWPFVLGAVAYAAIILMATGSSHSAQP